MITRIDAGKAVGGNIIGTGRLTQRRALGMAFGAAVGIALLASVAVSQYSFTSSAPTAASAVKLGGELQRQLAWTDARDAAPAPAIPAAQGAHQRQLALTDQRDAGLPGARLTGPRLQEQLYRDHVRDYGLPTTLGGDRSLQRGPGWFEARDFAPVAPSLTGTSSQQSRLYEVEVRDNGQGTTGGDSGPCLPLQDPCNR